MKETFEAENGVLVHLYTGRDVPTEHLEEEQLSKFKGDHTHVVIEVEDDYRGLAEERAQSLFDAIKSNAIEGYNTTSLAGLGDPDEGIPDLEDAKMLQHHDTKKSTWALSFVSENGDQGQEYLESVLREALVLSGIPGAEKKPELPDFASDDGHAFSLAYVPLEEASSKDEIIISGQVYEGTRARDNRMTLNISFDTSAPGVDYHDGSDVGIGHFDPNRLAMARRMIHFLATAMDSGYLSNRADELPKYFEIHKMCFPSAHPTLSHYSLNISAPDEEHRELELAYLNRLLHEVEEKGLDAVEADMESKLPGRPRSKVAEVKSVQKSGEKEIAFRTVEDVMTELQKDGHIKDMQTVDFLRLADQIHRRLTKNDLDGPGKK